MADIILMTGGARSGKSTLAEQFAQERGGMDVVYIATASVTDDEMRERVRKHRAQRPSKWETLEQFDKFIQLPESQAFCDSKAVLIDCLGFMLNNIMYYCGIDWDLCPKEDMERVEKAMCRELLDLIGVCRAHGKSLIMVTNEVGMSLVPENRVSRYYRDILGRANRLAAEKSDEVYLLVAGIPLKIKGSGGIGGTGCDCAGSGGDAPSRCGSGGSER